MCHSSLLTHTHTHTHTHTAFIRGSTQALGDFTLEVGISSGSSSSTGGKAPLFVSYWGSSGVLLADLKGKLGAAARGAAPRAGSEETSRARAMKRATAGVLPDEVLAGSNVVVVRVAAPGPFTVDAVLRKTTAEERVAVEEEDEDFEPGTEDVAKVKIGRSDWMFFWYAIYHMS